MTLDDFGFLGRAARVVLQVFTLWKDHVDALVASSAGSKREGWQKFTEKTSGSLRRFLNLVVVARFK